MVEETQAQAVSKSAKRRAAAKKAKENAENAAPETNVQAKQPKAAEAKAKAEPAKPATPAAAEPKAKAKAKAKVKTEAETKAQPKAEPKPQPAAEAPTKAAAKKQPAKAKGTAKAAAKPQAEEQPKKKEPEADQFLQFDDGTGPEWEVSTGLTKKQQRRKDRVEQEKAEAKATGVKPGQAQQHIPGMPTAADIKAAAAATTVVPQSVAATPEQVAAAAVAAAQAAAAAALAAEKEKESNKSTATVKVPEAKIGIVIGPKGSKIKLVQEKTGARIDTSGDVFTITGEPQGVAQAEAAVKELVAKGYTSLEYDDFSENFVAAHPSYFPDIIGKGGVVIRKIKEELGVVVTIPDAPKNAPPGKKYKVALAGKTESVEKAKEVITDIMMYYHHPITHPDVVHEEMEVADWSLRFIIGKAGSELRHIQNNYKVKMNIPREHSLNQKVVIVGDQFGVERAKTYVEKVIWKAEHEPRGRDRGEGGGDDGWGEEDEDEPWMKEYLYKR